MDAFFAPPPREAKRRTRKPRKKGKQQLLAEAAIDGMATDAMPPTRTPHTEIQAPNPLPHTPSPPAPTVNKRFGALTEPGHLFNADSDPDEEEDDEVTLMPPARPGSPPDAPANWRRMFKDALTSPDPLEPDPPEPDSPLTPIPSIRKPATRRSDRKPKPRAH